MDRNQARAATVFSCLGHLYIHLFTAIFFVIVLSLEKVWQTPYSELIKVWTLGSIMVGAVALPAGLISDRVGARAMMVIFYIGMGISSVAAGFTHSPATLLHALTGIGIFAAIYHPVGIPWLVRSTHSGRGKALGFNGIFGSMGTAGAALVAGFLIDIASWRMAFIVPGLISVITGAALWVMSVRGQVVEGGADASKHSPAARRDVFRAGAILLICMFLAGLIYHSTQTSLPKVFEIRQQSLIGDSAFGVGVLVAVVYTIAGIMQVAGGHLADHYSLKRVYLGALFLQIPLLYLASSAAGLTLMLASIFMVMSGVAALPAENMLLARYTPSHRHGLMFGLKFVLSFGAAPAAIQIVAYFTGTQIDGFQGVFVFLAVLALCSWSFAYFLPAEQSTVATTVGSAGAYSAMTKEP